MWKSKLCTGLASEMTDSLTSRMTVKVAQHVDNKNFSCPWVHKKGGLVLSSQEKKRCTPTCQYTQSLCNPSLLQKQTGTRSHSPPYSCIMPRDSVTDQRKIKGDVNVNPNKTVANHLPFLPKYRSTQFLLVIIQIVLFFHGLFSILIHFSNVIL